MATSEQTSKWITTAKVLFFISGLLALVSIAFFTGAIWLDSGAVHKCVWSGVLSTSLSVGFLIAGVVILDEFV